MKEYILPIILSAFIIYLFYRKKDLIEGIKLNFLGGLGRGAERGGARALERGAAAEGRIAERFSQRAARRTSRYSRDLRGTAIKTFDDIGSVNLNKILGENHGLTKEAYEGLGETGQKMISRGLNSKEGLRLAEDVGAEAETALGSYIKELEKGGARDEQVLADLERQAQEETVWFEQMQKIKGDFPPNFRVPRPGTGTAGDMEAIYAAEAKNIGITTRVRERVTQLIRNNPKMSILIGSGILLYEIVEAYKNTEECEQICTDGPPGSEENPFSEWMETHDQDEYDEMCGGDSIATCDTYCLANGSGACSESAESSRAANAFANDVEAALIGDSDDPDDEGLLGGLLDILRGLLPDDWKTTLYVVGVCCCLIISSFVTFVVYRRIGAKAISTVAKIKSSNSAFANDARAFNQSIKLGQNGGGKVMNNKMIIMIIFFIFIIYNEWGRK